MTQIIKTDQIIKLYKKGYFPMANSAESEEINFYKPQKRFVIPINLFHIPKKLFSEFKKNEYNFTINSDFSSVIKYCAYNRKKNETWINKIIKNTYIELYKKGFGKSIECFYKKNLVGGLYGLHIGACFFGESMFSCMKNTSKLCLLYLISILKFHNFLLLDSQFYNPHLVQFGGYEISDQEYQVQLIKGINKKCFFPDFFNYQKSLSILQLLSHKS